MKKVYVLLVTGLLAQIGSSALVQWKTEDGGNGHWYEAFYIPERISWNNANTIAAQHGGYLATITSSIENNFVFSLVSDSKYWYVSGHGQGPWLGAYQVNASTPSTGWHWVTGESWTYTNWASLEPTGEDGSAPYSNCLQFFGYGKLIDSTWNDTNANTNLNGYIVEYNIPEPCTLALFGLGGLLLRRRKK